MFSCCHFFPPDLLVRALLEVVRGCIKNSHLKIKVLEFLCNGFDLVEKIDNIQ